MGNRIIEFTRKKDLRFIKDLGQGACGQTVLLHDDVIEEYFVCKKYSPLESEAKAQLFSNFIREIKLLHILNHPNVVRVFNYYLYPEKYAGYILMEYVEGTDIEDFLRQNPDQINEIFLQAIEGFCHLEEHEILHRDIRPYNLLITKSGRLKIIDFGFGKKIFSGIDFGKSVSLNWWCEPPLEFKAERYDFATEVYFLGNLIKQILTDNDIDNFQYTSLLARMCNRDPEGRISSFTDVRQETLSAGFYDTPFLDSELATYRRFSNDLYVAISKVETSAKYIGDTGKIQKSLEDLHRNTMLEKNLPNNTLLIRCFINGSYYYNTSAVIPVSTVKDFIDLLRSCSSERKKIILGNLHTKLDTLKRYDYLEEDDIPF